MKHKSLFNLILALSLSLSMVHMRSSDVYARQSSSGIPTVVWNVTYTAGVNEQATDIAMDAIGNIYVIGNTGNGTNIDFRTIKYDSTGTLLWTVTYDDGGEEYAVKVATDSAGNVYVSGSSYKGGPDNSILIKYNASGVIQWVRTYDSGTEDMISGALPDELGNIYLAATHSWGNRYLIKYDSAGNIVWVNTDTQVGCNRSGDVVRDALGNLYITGYSCDKFRTTKYDSAGNILWDRIYDPGVFDYSYAIAIDDANNVYVAGHSGNNTSYMEAVILKYDPVGTLLWDRRYNGGTFAIPAGIGVDGLGDIYVGATKKISPSGNPVGMHLLKYDSAGNLIWDIPQDNDAGAGGGGLVLDTVGSAGTWGVADRLDFARSYHSLTLLPNGKVLATGGWSGSSAMTSAEVYDPLAGTWISTGSMVAARRQHTATLLPNGKVLVAGGWNGSALASAELYDPATGTWSTTGSMATGRFSHTTTLLPNGKVLVAGGWNGSALVSAELYDPATGTWGTTGSMYGARYAHATAALSDGKVLVTGGLNGSALASAEVYDPAAGTWSVTGSLAHARHNHTATLLPNSQVLIAAGTDNCCNVSSAELYDPNTGTWNTTGNLTTGRERHAAVLLPDGKVLIAGGNNSGSALASTETYNPATGIWSIAYSMTVARDYYTMVLLPNGKVLAAGGFNAGNNELDGAELYYAMGRPADIYQAGFSFNGVNNEFRTIRYSTATRVVALPEATQLYPGDPLSVALNIQNADDLYAAQATCTVNPSVLELQSGTFGDFFDPVNRLIGTNQADAVSGTWLGAISQRSPALPLSGDGLFATLSYTATTPGTTAISCDPMLSDQDGFTQTVIYSGTTVTILPFATINGVATYQGRLSHSGITITAIGPVTRTASTNGTGNFVLDSLRAGDYAIAADTSLYLSVCTTTTVTSGQVLTLPAIVLRGGDANDDGVINIGDATLIAANFGMQVPPGDARADINADAIVNIRDLAILGRNYGLIGCQDW